MSPSTLWDAPQPALPTSGPVFQQTTSNLSFGSGLILVRPLANGGVELVKVNSVNSLQFGSEAVGQEIAADPAQMAFLQGIK